MELIEILDDLAQRGRIDVQDVDRLQAVCGKCEKLDLATVETILAVDMVCRSVCSEWSEYIKDKVLAHVVGGNGQISDENLTWLTAAFSRNGIVNDHEQFELLVRVIEELDVVPEQFVELILAQVEMAVVHERGPLAHIKVDGVQVISRQDVDLIRRILVGSEGRRLKPVSEQEMAFLFDLNEQTLPSANHASWQDLLVKAMTNFVLGGNGELAESRSIALASENSKDLGTRVNLCVAHLKMVAHMASGLGNEAGFQMEKPAAVPADWIIDRFQNSGTFDSDDAAMVDYVTQMAVGKGLSSKSLSMIS